jgi:hypothetical protein
MLQSLLYLALVISSSVSLSTNKPIISIEISSKDLKRQIYYTGSKQNWKKAVSELSK